jgi:hypothetical protein
MATTTPNFGWSVPTSSDLVKNGATAIETLGDSIDASLVDLKGGTTGQVLAKASNTNMDFSWTTPAAGGGGKVLQVVAATYGTSQTSTSSTYVDTGLTATITPSASSSKILVLVNHNACKSDGGGIALKLRRASTDIITFSYYGGAGPAAVDIGSIGTAYLDSPSTTSATIYKTMFANQIPANAATLQNGSLATSTIVLLEIGA